MPNRLRKFRQAVGLSQYALAKLVGSYQHRIWLLEHDYIEPGEEEKTRIARVLQVPAEAIFPTKKAPSR